MTLREIPSIANVHVSLVRLVRLKFCCYTHYVAARVVRRFGDIKMGPFAATILPNHHNIFMGMLVLILKFD